MSITLITGPMFSGKSSRLITMVTRYALAKKKCIVVKYKGDTRYGVESVVSHNKQTYPCIPVDDQELIAAIPTLLSHDVIAIDEGQFFPSLLTVCNTLSDNNKIVIVSGLIATSMDTPFKPIADLACVATDIIYNKAVCMRCGADATKSFRFDQSTTQENIGSTDKYEARCRKCFSQKQ